MFPYGPIPLLALVVWPLITIVIFLRYKLPVAAASATLGAMLFLPDGEGVIDFPLIPPLDKENIATISVGAMVFFKYRHRLREARWLRGIDLVPLVAMCGIVGTWQNNQSDLVFGYLAGTLPDAKMVTLPGLNAKDVLAYFVRDFLQFVMPFIMARAVYRSREDLREFLHVFVAFAFSYIPLILIELRLSPIVHGTIYGYYPHTEFAQAIRWGGWRPQVFFYHGLFLSKFMLGCTLCALALWLGGEKKAWKVDSKVAYIVLAVTTFFTKSSGIIIYLFFFSFLFLKGSMKTQARVMLILAGLTLFYPYGRATGILDTEAVIKEIKKISPDRAQSLGYRFRNENEVSKRAQKKVWFGWGGWARGHIWDEKVGRDLSVIDGFWLIRFSEQGVFGLAGPFLVMLLPVILAVRRYTQIPDKRDQQMVLVFSAFSLMYALECLPNAISTNIPFFASGALWGVVSNLTDPKYIKQQKKKRRRRRPPPGYMLPPPGASPPPPPGWAPLPPGAPPRSR